MKAFVFLFLFSLFSVSSLLASMSGSHEVGQRFAQSLQKSTEKAATSTSPRLVPGYTTTTPPEAFLTAPTLGDAALRETNRTEAGQFLKATTSDRQKFTIDPETDPLFRKGDEVLKNPHGAVGVLVERGVEERGEAVMLTCEEAGSPVQQTCHHQLEIEIAITPGWVEETWSCGGYDVPDYSDHTNESGGRPRRYMRFGHSPNNPGCRHGGCAVNHQRIEHPEIITITKEEWVDDCARLEKLTDEGRCQYESKVCTDPSSTKMIQERPLTKDCWQYRQTYTCQYPSKNTCSALRAKGCVQTASRCKERVGDVCVAFEQTYACPFTKKGLKKGRVGVGSPFCITGNCADSSYKANGEMLDVMAKLSVFKEMQKDIQRGSFEIFKGTDYRCSRNCIDFKDCCQNMKGWGTSLHLARCSSEEKLLAQLKDKNLCHQVGTYCAKKVLGVCVSKKTSYCCFGNKLLRLIQEQGRAQLGISWGMAFNPSCRGLRPEELGRIDFSRMDMSEIFEDIMASYKQPDVSGVQTVTAERLKENLRHIQAGTRKQPLTTGENGGL